ncbi:MAG: outer membrane protein assembly factor BamA, partial [Gammaproteobacteria bacterium]|nr:outer membrane protein assembly factor BamA [Gammaproteobacteria bacterium]
LVLSGSVSQSNVFGTGNRLSAQINSGSVNTVYSLSYTNPYYTIDGISLGYDVYRRDVDSSSLDNVSEYKTSTIGAGMRFGLPINERDFISFGLTYEQTSISLVPDDLSDSVPATQYQTFVGPTGKRDDDTLRFDTSWARDTRNSFLFPTKGLFQRAAAEIGTPAGSLQYYKLSLQHQQFFPLSKSFTLMLNAEAGIGGGLGDEDLPFFKNFYVGGTSSVRGFENGTLGPKDANGDAIGGNKRMVANAELFFPLPGLKDDQSLRMSAFVDAGAAFGSDQQFAFDELRYSAGVAILWVSPLGPLKFSLAQPLVSKGSGLTEDQTEVFQFTLGNTF